MACLASECVFVRKTYSLRKLFISSVFILSTCVMVIFWTQSHLSFGPLFYKANDEQTTVRFFKVIELLDQHVHGQSTEEKLLNAVDKLPFKVMTPSSLLLEDLYFIPSTLKLVSYNNPVLNQPLFACGRSEFLLILVPLHPQSVRERRAIRETWGTLARGRAWPWKGNNYPVKLFFVLGVADRNLQTEYLNSSKMEQISNSETFGNDKSSYSFGNKRNQFSQKDSKTSSKLFKAKENNIMNSWNQRLRYAQNESFNKSDSQHNSDQYNDKTTRQNLKRWESLNASEGLPDDITTDKRKRDKMTFSLMPDQRSTLATRTHIFKTEDYISQEISTFDDILQFDMVDSYANLTRKIILSLQWSVSSCSSATFILKVDPDVFVNVPLLTVFLKHYGEMNSVYGHIYPNSWVERKGKWAVPKTALPIPKYPIYAAGNAYVLSKDAAAKVIDLAPHFPYVRVEDAFITGILASVGGVDRVNVGGFTKWTESRPDPCDFVTDRKYAGNNFTEYDHRMFWREIIDNGSYRCNR